MTEIIGIATKDSPLTELPTPSEYHVDHQAIYDEDTQRDVKGTLHTSRIAMKRQVHLGWRFLEPSQFKQLCTLTDSDDLQVTCYDENIDAYYSGTFMRDASFSHAAVGPWGDRPLGVANISMTLTEK